MTTTGDVITSIDAINNLDDLRLIRLVITTRIDALGKHLHGNLIYGDFVGFTDTSGEQRTGWVERVNDLTIAITEEHDDGTRTHWTVHPSMLTRKLPGSRFPSKAPTS